MQTNFIECPGCGKKVHDHAPACPQCGTKIDVEEPGDVKGVRHPPLDLPSARSKATEPQVGEDEAESGK